MPNAQSNKARAEAVDAMVSALAKWYDAFYPAERKGWATFGMGCIGEIIKRTPDTAGHADILDGRIILQRVLKDREHLCDPAAVALLREAAEAFMRRLPRRARPQGLRQSCLQSLNPQAHGARRVERLLQPGH